MPPVRIIPNEINSDSPEGEVIAVQCDAMSKDSVAGALEKTLDEFKISIKTWEPENCPCELCNPIVPGFGRIKQNCSKNSDFYYY